MKKKIITSISYVTILLVVFIATSFILISVNKNVKVSEYNQLLPNYDFKVESKVNGLKISDYDNKVVVKSGAYVLNRQKGNYGHNCKGECEFNCKNSYGFILKVANLNSDNVENGQIFYVLYNNNEVKLEILKTININNDIDSIWTSSFQETLLNVIYDNTSFSKQVNIGGLDNE